MSEKKGQQLLACDMSDGVDLMYCLECLCEFIDEKRSFSFLDLPMVSLAFIAYVGLQINLTGAMDSKFKSWVSPALLAEAYLTCGALLGTKFDETA
jgi:hypothetical protein